jgi:hypothetical protein
MIPVYPRGAEDRHRRLGDLPDGLEALQELVRDVLDVQRSAPSSLSRIRRSSTLGS